MAFFKSSPNLPDGEKARLEFHFQQLAECIGFESFNARVLAEDAIYGVGGNRTAEEVVQVVADHLSHDVSDLKVQFVDNPAKACGGGG
jgi:tellurite resistance protein